MTSALNYKNIKQANNKHTHGNKMAQTISIKQSISVKHIQWKKNRNRLFVFKQSSHNETIFKRNLFDRRKWQVVATRSEIKPVISRVRRASRAERVERVGRLIPVELYVCRYVGSGDIYDWSLRQWLAQAEQWRALHSASRDHPRSYRQSCVAPCHRSYKVHRQTIRYDAIFLETSRLAALRMSMLETGVLVVIKKYWNLRISIKTKTKTHSQLFFAVPITTSYYYYYYYYYYYHDCDILWRKPLSRFGH